MGASANFVGSSSGKGFTPQANKNLQPTDLTGLVAYQVVGKEVYKYTVIYFRPDQLAEKIAKYKAQKCKLVKLGFAPKPDKPAPKKTNTPKRYRGGRPIVCLNTGRMFQSGSMLGDRYKLSIQMVNYVLKGTIYSAKGRRFRYATPDEIEAAKGNPDWKFDGELFDVMPNKRVKPNPKKAV